MPYDVVHRDPRFDLANVSYVHYYPAGDPGAAGSLAVLRQLSLVSFDDGPVHATSSRGVPPQDGVADTCSSGSSPSCRSSRLLKALMHGISSRGVPPAHGVADGCSKMYVHLLLQFRMVLKEKCCV